MIIKFKAFASIKDKECGWKRIAESIHETEPEAKEAVLHFAGKYPEEQYTGVSIKDGRTKTWMTNEENGCVLLFEGRHFEIL